MWFRLILTAFALAVVLYLQFAFDIKDWIRQSASPTAEHAEPGSETEPAQGP